MRLLVRSSIHEQQYGASLPNGVSIVYKNKVAAALASGGSAKERVYTVSEMCPSCVLCTSPTATAVPVATAAWLCCAAYRYALKLGQTPREWSCFMLRGTAPVRDKSCSMYSSKTAQVHGVRYCYSNSVLTSSIPILFFWGCSTYIPFCESAQQ